jgi:hypothetical protein
MFHGPDKLLASEFQPNLDPTSIWHMNSGTLYRQGGAGYTGKPQDGSVKGGNDSSVFRMEPVQKNFTNYDVSMFLKIDSFSPGGKVSPAQDFDGAHIWVGFQSQYQLYAISVDRRDGTMIIKKKCAGGPNPSNGGTYYDLTPSASGRPVPIGSWQHIQVSVRQLTGGSVSISASRDGYTLNAVDTGIGCAPIAVGGVGLRGDNTEMHFTDINIIPM